jgi:D-sedoheptulose 7-phosphate isomerase
MGGNIIKKSIEKSLQEISDIITEISLLDDQIVLVINEIINAIKQGKKIILFGNGGSAADAQHIAAEFIGRFNIERQSFPAIALTTDTSVITSLGNDYSFDKIFSRQCESLVAKGDIVIGISTSGNSKNVENGLIASKKNGAHTIGLLGNDGGQIKKIVDIPLIVNSSSTPRIQEAHRVLYHIICDIVEKELATQLKN